MAKERIIINPKDNSVTLRLRDVRLSFPSLWEKKKWPDTPEERLKYEAIFLIKEGSPEFKLATEAVAHITKEVHKNRRLDPSKVCFRDTDGKLDKMGEPMEGYGKGIWELKAADTSPPQVVDHDLTPLRAGSSRPYAGCYVNATVRLYGWNNPKGGIGISANLRAVQFYRDGEAFGSGGGVDVEDEFDVVELADEDLY